MYWKTTLAVFLATATLAGCGGGHNDGIGYPDPSAMTTILEIERRMNVEIANENTGRLMDAYSNIYLDSESLTKADIRRAIEETFKDVEIIRVDALDPTLDPKYSTQAGAGGSGSSGGSGQTEADTPVRTNPAGTVLYQRVFTYIVYRDRKTAQQNALVIRGYYNWVNERGVWRLIATEGGALKTLRAYRSGDTTNSNIVSDLGGQILR